MRKERRQTLFNNHGLRDPKVLLLRMRSFRRIQKQIFDLKMDFAFLSANPNLDFESNESFLGKDSLDLKSANLAPDFRICDLLRSFGIEFETNLIDQRFFW